MVIVSMAVVLTFGVAKTCVLSASDRYTMSTTEPVIPVSIWDRRECNNPGPITMLLIREAQGVVNVEGKQKTGSV